MTTLGKMALEYVACSCIIHFCELMAREVIPEIYWHEITRFFTLLWFVTVGVIILS
jgi:hypothetical protein